MTSLSDFKKSLDQSKPLSGLTPLLEALWWEGKGDWDKAHKIAQDIHNADAAWVHAYLHRKEGEDWNADYWYSRAGKRRTDAPFDKEWEEIVSTLL